MSKTGLMMILMKNWILSVLLLLLTLPAYADFYGKVVRVTDGDTIIVLKDKKQIRVRLYGIDAPESKQAFGNKSRQYLANIIAGKQVKIVDKGNDIYKRLLGYVIYNNQNVNELMVANGYAWAYSYRNQYAVPKFKTLENRARSQRKGLWIDKHPINPYQFRKKNK